MSTLLQANGDDYVEAALKHLEDAHKLLESGRHCGSAYLSGYVVECCFKALIQIETGLSVRTHELEELAAEVEAVILFTSSSTAKYVSRGVVEIRNAAIAAWRPEMRYHAEASTTKLQAESWIQEAKAIFQSTVRQMVLDGAV